MFEVIPSINCHDKDFDCVTQKVRAAEGFAAWVHLDVADARLALNRSWSEPERWGEVGTKLLLEVHLMVEEPELAVEAWLRAGAKRIIIHLEAVLDNRFRAAPRDPHHLVAEIKSMCDAHGASLMLAILTETPLGALES